MRRLIIALVSSLLLLQSYPQELEVSFTGVFDQSYILLDSIKIMNLSQDCDTVLVYPDTVLNLVMVGVTPATPDLSGILMSETRPNPFSDIASFSVVLPMKDQLYLGVYDVAGRRVTEYHSFLPAGKNDFILQGGKSGWYVVKASCSSGSLSRKISCLGNGTKAMEIISTGGRGYKNTAGKTEINDDFQFTIGDKLVYTGYVNTFTGVLESVLLDVPDISQVYTFQLASNIPCPGIPTVDYEGQTYNTVQIFNQCWLKENLNAGIMILGGEDMTDNGIIEKYCFENEPDSCLKYGGLYQWEEMMQYTMQAGPQGICPPGWHVPSDEEYKQLWGAADSQYGYPDPEWNDIGYMGYDADTNLKSQTGWNLNLNGTDKHGFKALPGGSLHPDYGFIDAGDYSLYWTSSDTYTPDEAWFWSIDVVYGGLNLWQYNYQIGFSVRCLKDE